MIILSITIFKFSSSPAQTVEQTYKLALLALNNGDTASAISLLNRVAFFASKKNNYKSLSNLYLANIAFYQKNYNKSIKHLKWAYFASENDSLSDEITFFSTYVYLTQKDYISAEEELLNIDTSNSDYNKKRYELYMATIGFLKKDFDQAYKHFKTIYNDTISLKKLLKKAKKISKRNSIWYLVASSIIPGSGQIITGHIKQGLNSFVLISGLAILFYQITKYYSWLEGFAVVYPWFQRYLFGGSNDAYDYAEINKAKKLAIIYQEITNNITK